MRDRGHAVRIGITGPIGCGKSTVARWLGERPGVVVVDADQLARDVLEPGTAEVESVYRRFGDDLRGAHGALDRAALARIVFDDPDALRDLESIVHPGVRPRILATIAAAEATGADAVIIEAIKLLEGGLADLCDEVWLITCSGSIQEDRLVRRGTSPADAAARIAAQGDLAGRVRGRATRTLDTDGPPEATAARAVEALLEVLERSG